MEAKYNASKSKCMYLCTSGFHGSGNGSGSLRFGFALDLTTSHLARQYSFANKEVTEMSRMRDKELNASSTTATIFTATATESDHSLLRSVWVSLIGFGFGFGFGILYASASRVISLSL